MSDWSLRRPAPLAGPGRGAGFSDPGREAARGGALLAPAIALVVVALGLALGWRGVDMAAAAHRVAEFHQDGFVLWDASWYGGQWTLDYSVVFAPVAATLGLHLLALVAAAVSALAFERLVTRQWGRRALFAAVVFAVGTVVETSIGQLPFLSGEALALTALWAATRRRWPVAWALAAGTTLLSPLAGAFLALGALAWVLASVRARADRAAGARLMPPPEQRGRRWGLAVLGIPAAVALPVVATAVLFPGQGNMPFSLIDCSWDLAIALTLFCLTPRHQRVVRTGILLYALTLVGSYLVPSPIGGNVGRLGDCLALPVAALLLWPRRRWVLAAVAVPLVVSGWGPAWGAMTSLPSQPAAQRPFYTPLDTWLKDHDPDGTLGRVEVVPTQQHWESVWVAGAEPLARGWERQTDVTQNPIFYRAGALTPPSYRSWLLDNGVAFVALPAAPLDYAGRAEGRLIAAGIPGLAPVWSNRDWRVWAVTGSTGVVSGAGSVVSIGAQRVVIRAAQAGALTVRVVWDGNWAVTAGDACATSAGHWTRVEVTRPGTIVLSVTLDSALGRCRASP